MTTMLGPLRRARRIASGRTAVSSADVELCYADTWDRCRRPVGGLRGLELGEGDRVAVVGPNCHRNLELYQAVAGAGMVLVPLNRRHTEAELRYVHDHAGVAVLFAGRDVGSARESVKHVTIWARSASGCSPAAPRPTCATTCRRTRSPASSTLAARRAPQRGVTLTHRNLVANVFNYQAFAPFRPQTCWLIAAPLFRHPAVPEAAVFGVPDHRWGEAVYAVVVPRGDVTSEDSTRHCREQIASYKVPKRFELRTEPLPKSGAGKVLRRELREPHWRGHDTRVGGA